MPKTYIEREKAIEFIRNNTPHFNGETTMQCVERSLTNVPAADVVEVRHGEWINGVTGYTCSVCDKQEPTNRFLYCPNCGADMRGENK